MAKRKGASLMPRLDSPLFGRRANADLRYGVPLVKTVLLGNVLAQTGLGKLEWNGSRVTNNDKANAFVRTSYRKGWELPS